MIVEESRSNKLINYAEAVFLPLVLAVLFVIQNQYFNVWLGIYSKTYSFRLSLVNFALGLILYGPTLLFQKRYKYIYLSIISLLVSVIFIAQFLYYRYSQSFLQFSAIRYLGQAGSVAGTARTLLSPELILFFVNFLIVAVAFALTFRKKYKDVILPIWEKVIIVLAIALVVFFVDQVMGNTRMCLLWVNSLASFDNSR